MASATPDQIEREFAELPKPLQLSVLERLERHVRTSVAEYSEAEQRELQEMACDPEIIREIQQIDEEFRAANKL